MSNHTKRKEEIAHLHKQNSDQRNEIKRLKFELIEAKDSLQANAIKYNDRNGELTLSNSKLICGVLKLEGVIRASSEAGCNVSQLYIQGFRDRANNEAK